VFNLLDSFSAGLSLLFIVFLELIAVVWIYGEWRVFFGKTFYPSSELLAFGSIKWGQMASFCLEDEC